VVEAKVVDKEVDRSVVELFLEEKLFFVVLDGLIELEPV
jgi:hypothetical protein